MVTLKTWLTNVLKRFLNNIHLAKENVPRVEKNACSQPFPTQE